MYGVVTVGKALRFPPHPPLAYSMRIPSSQLVGCFLEHHTLNHLFDTLSLNRIPSYRYNPPVSWNVFIPRAAIDIAYEHQNRGLPNRVHLGLLALLLCLDWRGDYQRITLDYLQDNGISYDEIKQSINHCRERGILRRVRSRKGYAMKWKRDTLAKLK